MEKDKREGTGLQDPFDEFVVTFVPLLRSPFIRIKVGSLKYSLPKALVCKHSTFFSDAFEEGIEKAEAQEVTLAEKPGVVSERGFQCIVQWLLLGRVIFGSPPIQQGITDAIHFAAMANMLKMYGMEEVVSRRIEQLITIRAPESATLKDLSECQTTHITREHILSGLSLPDSHPVRHVLARAVVNDILQSKGHKFQKELQELPYFAIDVVQEMQKTLKTFKIRKGKIYFSDHLEGEVAMLQSSQTSTDSFIL